MVKPYAPRPETVVAFTEGDCWHLAWTLHQMTGRPVIFANPDTSGFDPYYWEHVGLVLTSGEVLDIEGVFNRETWRQMWARDGVLYQIDNIDDPYVFSRWLSGMDRQYTVDTRAVARRLLRSVDPAQIGG